jgi:hypothetical protein
MGFAIRMKYRDHKYDKETESVDRCMDALRISPNFTSRDWEALDRNDREAWSRAADVLKDRLEGRFLRCASKCLRDQDSGFVVLAIDCLLAETIQQFIEGITDGRNQSTKMITRFLKGTRFQPHFDDKARKAFYLDIRCGLLHQAEAKRMWLVRRGQAALLREIANGQG